VLFINVDHSYYRRLWQAAREAAIKGNGIFNVQIVTQLSMWAEKKQLACLFWEIMTLICPSRPQVYINGQMIFKEILSVNKQYIMHMGLYFLMMVSIKIIAVWAVTSCSFRELSCHRYQSRWHFNIYIYIYIYVYIYIYTRLHGVTSQKTYWLNIYLYTTRSIQIRSALHCIMTFHISKFFLDFSFAVIHKPKFSRNTYQFNNLT